MNVIDPFMAGYLPILVVDSNGLATRQLADRLRHRGFHTDVAISCSAAHIAVRAKHYRSIVIVADLSRAADRDCLAAFRKKCRARGSSPSARPRRRRHPQKLIRRSIDARLITPFSKEDLASRLSALALRSRPP